MYQKHTRKYVYMYKKVHACSWMFYRGEKHAEEVDRGLSDVTVFDCNHDGRQESQVAEREQQSC